MKLSNIAFLISIGYLIPVFAGCKANKAIAVLNAGYNIAVNDLGGLADIYVSRAGVNDLVLNGSENDVGRINARCLCCGSLGYGSLGSRCFGNGRFCSGSIGCRSFGSGIIGSLAGIGRLT